MENDFDYGRYCYPPAYGEVTRVRSTMVSSHDPYYDFNHNLNGYQYMESELASQDAHTDSGSLVQLAYQQQPFSATDASPEFHGQESESLMTTKQSNNMESSTPPGNNVQTYYHQHKDLDYLSLTTQYTYPAYDHVSETIEQNVPPISHTPFSTEDEPAAMEIGLTLEQRPITDANTNYQPSQKIANNQQAETSKAKQRKYKNDEEMREANHKKSSAARRELVNKMSAEERRDFNRRMRYGIPLDKGELTFEDYIQIEEKKIKTSEREKKLRSIDRMILSTPAKTPKDMEKIRMIKEKRARKNEKARKQKAEKKVVEQDETNQKKGIETNDGMLNTDLIGKRSNQCQQLPHFPNLKVDGLNWTTHSSKHAYNQVSETYETLEKKDLPITRTVDPTGDLSTTIRNEMSDTCNNHQASHALTDNHQVETSKTKRWKYMSDEERKEVISKRQSALRKEILSKMSAEERRDYNRRKFYGIPLEKGELTFEDYIQIEEKKIDLREKRKQRRFKEKMILSTPVKTPEDMEKVRKIMERKAKQNVWVRNWQRRKVEEKKSMKTPSVKLSEES